MKKYLIHKNSFNFQYFDNLTLSNKFYTNQNLNFLNIINLAQNCFSHIIDGRSKGSIIIDNCNILLFVIVYFLNNHMYYSS